MLDNWRSKPVARILKLEKKLNCDTNHPLAHVWAQLPLAERGNAVPYLVPTGWPQESVRHSFDVPAPSRDQQLPRGEATKELLLVLPAIWSLSFVWTDLCRCVLWIGLVLVQPHPPRTKAELLLACHHAYALDRCFRYPSAFLTYR